MSSPAELTWEQEFAENALWACMNDHMHTRKNGENCPNCNCKLEFSPYPEKTLKICEPQPKGWEKAEFPQHEPGALVKRLGLKNHDYHLHQPGCPDGVTIRGKIVHAESPGEFYVLPESDWTCLCRKPTDYINPIAKEGRLTESPYGRYTRFIHRIGEAVESNLSGHLRSSYSKNEMVACHMGEEWLRGVVTKDSNPTTFKVQVRLVDLGRRLELPISDVAVLPRCFHIKYEQIFTRKCSLFGIISIGMIWTKSNKEHFKGWVENMDAIITVRRPAFKEPVPQFQCSPYEVDVTIPEFKEIPGGICNVALLMCKSFNALGAHPFPFRPHLTRMSTKKKNANDEIGGDQTDPHAQALVKMRAQAESDKERKKRERVKNVLTPSVLEILDPFPNLLPQIPVTVQANEVKRLNRKLEMMDLAPPSAYTTTKSGDTDEDEEDFN